MVVSTENVCAVLRVGPWIGDDRGWSGRPGKGRTGWKTCSEILSRTTTSWMYFYSPHCYFIFLSTKPLHIIIMCIVLRGILPNPNILCTNMIFTLHCRHLGGGLVTKFIQVKLEDFLVFIPKMLNFVFFFWYSPSTLVCPQVCQCFTMFWVICGMRLGERRK